MHYRDSASRRDMNSGAESWKAMGAPCMRERRQRRSADGSGDTAGGKGSVKRDERELIMSLVIERLEGGARHQRLQEYENRGGASTPRPERAFA